MELIFINYQFESTCDNFVEIACKRKCSKYVLKRCALLDKPPYICNVCNKKTGCRFQKYYYRAKEAQKDCEELLKEAKEGVHLFQDDCNIIMSHINSTPRISLKKHLIAQSKNFYLKKNYKK